jgi:hypothetical protein
MDLKDTLSKSVDDYLALTGGDFDALRGQLAAYLDEVAPLADELIAEGNVDGLAYLRDAIFVKAGTLLEDFTVKERQAIIGVVLGVTRALIVAAV